MASPTTTGRPANGIGGSRRKSRRRGGCNDLRRGGSRRISPNCRCFCSEAKVGATHGPSFLSCVVIGCCLCVLQASATEDKTLRGPGAQNCGEFAFDLRVNRNTENTYFDWAEGFISGMNWIDAMTDHTAKNIMALSIADQKQVIRNYCNDHPLVPLGSCNCSL